MIKNTILRSKKKLQMEDVIFTRRSRGVLGDTIWNFFKTLAEIVWLRLTIDEGYYSTIQTILQVEDVIFI